jgi:hypothetical protein
MDQADRRGGQIGLREGTLGVAQERRHVGRLAVRHVRTAVVRVVARPDDRDLAPRHDEEVPPVDHAAARVIPGAARHHQVHRPRQPRRGRGRPPPRESMGQCSRPRTGGVDDGAGTDVEGRVGQPVAHAQHERAVAPASELLGVHVGADGRAEGRRRRRGPGDDPLGPAHLVVEPDGAARDLAVVDERVQAQALGARHDSPAGQPQVGVGDAVAAVVADRVGHRQRDPQGPGIPRGMPVGGHAEGQRVHQVRRHHRHGAALADEEPHLAQVQRLQRPEAAVQGLEGVERGGAAQIAAVDEGHRPAAPRRLPRGQRAVDPGADDHEIVGRIGQAGRVALHRARRPLYDRGL